MKVSGGASNAPRRRHDDRNAGPIYPQGCARGGSQGVWHQVLSVVRRIEDSPAGDLIGVISLFAILFWFLAITAVFA